MTKLEQLEQDIYDAGIVLCECRHGAPELKGDPACIYVSQFGATICIDKTLKSRERSVFLAHELGHVMTLFKSENAAWRWAYDYMIPYDELRETGISDICEDYEVPRWFADGAITYYTVTGHDLQGGEPKWHRSRR